MLHVEEDELRSSNSGSLSKYVESNKHFPVYLKGHRLEENLSSLVYGITYTMLSCPPRRTIYTCGNWGFRIILAVTDVISVDKSNRRN